jgi:hypothetical protein
MAHRHAPPSEWWRLATLAALYRLVALGAMMSTRATPIWSVCCRSVPLPLWARLALTSSSSINSSGYASPASGECLSWSIVGYAADIPVRRVLRRWRRRWCRGCGQRVCDRLEGPPAVSAASPWHSSDSEAAQVYCALVSAACFWMDQPRLPTLRTLETPRVLLLRSSRHQDRPFVGQSAERGSDPGGRDSERSRWRAPW